MKTSIEVAYWLVDDDGELTRPGPSSADFERTGEGGARPLVRVETPPCNSILELRSAFASRLEDAISRAAAAGTRLVPLGTPINAGRHDASSDGSIDASGAGGGPRPADEPTDDAEFCAGTRIRVAERGVADQLNALLALDPAFALLNSSPYARGERVANSARALRLRGRNAGGAASSRRWDYADGVDEWERRLEPPFEGSSNRPGDGDPEGVDDDRHTDGATDGGASGPNERDATAATERVAPRDAWKPLALRREGLAVEWRSPDAALPNQILRLAAAIADVMDLLEETSVRRDPDGVAARAAGGTDGAAGPGAVTSDGVVLPPVDTVREHADAAVREGLESRSLVAYLERMGFSVADYHPISMQIGGREYVTKSDARDLRLEYATRLEEDVADLAGGG